MNAKNMKFFFDLKEDPIKLDGPEGLRVVRPLIYVEKFNGNEVIVVRWNSDKEDDPYQYEFHLVTTLDQVYDQCAADPRNFKTMFIGQLKDFPEESFFHEGICDMFEGDGEKWVIFAVAPIGLKWGIPVHFVSEIILIGKEGRLIKPATYVKMDEWGIASDKLRKHTNSLYWLGGSDIP